MPCLDDLTDRLNPLLVRESRQMFKSWYFAASFLTVLGIGWFLALNSLRFGYAHDAETAGAKLFGAYYLLLTGALCVPVPFAAMHSFAFEHRDSAIELLRITPLTTRRIVWGKFWIAVLHAGLYLSALIPFMCFAYLLRGISLFAIVGWAVVPLLTSASLVMLALLMGLISSSSPRHVLATAGLLAGMVIAFAACAAVGQASQPGMAVCFLMPAMIASVFCLETAVLLARPRPFVEPVLFIDLRRIRLLFPLLNEITGLIRRHFPLEGHAVPGVSEEIPFRKAHRFTMDRFRQVNFLMCRTEYPYHRWNFLTFELAEPPLRQARRILDDLTVRYGWSTGDEMYRPYERELQGPPPDPGFPAIEPELLQRLEDAARELERVGDVLRGDEITASGRVEGVTGQWGRWRGAPTCDECDE